MSAAKASAALFSIINEISWIAYNIMCRSSYKGIMASLEDDLH